jgi:hypothetical protein
MWLQRDRCGLLKLAAHPANRTGCGGSMRTTQENSILQGSIPTRFEQKGQIRKRFPTNSDLKNEYKIAKEKSIRDPEPILTSNNVMKSSTRIIGKDQLSGTNLPPRPGNSGGTYPS